MIGYIYIISCKVNGKNYIGQVTHDYNRRFRRHLRTAFKTKRSVRNCKFYRAIRKYGPENFSVQCLDQKEFDEITECVKWLDEREIFFIKKFDSYENGYNSTTGGHNGYEFTEETLYKMGSGNRGRKLSEEEIEKRIAPLRGRKQTQEEIERRTVKLRGRTRTPEQCKRISDSLKGRAGVGKKIVYQYKDNVLLNTYSSLAESALKTGIGIGRINRCCLGQISCVDGYEFTYKRK